MIRKYFFLASYFCVILTNNSYASSFVRVRSSCELFSFLDKQHPQEKRKFFEDDIDHKLKGYDAISLNEETPLSQVKEQIIKPFQVDKKFSYLCCFMKSVILGGVMIYGTHILSLMIFDSILQDISSHFCNILVIRHADKWPNGSITPEGWQRASYIANCLQSMQFGEKNIPWIIDIFATDPSQSSMRPYDTAKVSANLLQDESVVLLDSGAHGAHQLLSFLQNSTECQNSNIENPYLAVVFSEHNQIVFFLKGLGIIANPYEKGRYRGDQSALDLLEQEDGYELLEEDKKLHWPKNCHTKGINAPESVNNGGSSNCFNRAILIESFSKLLYLEKNRKEESAYIPSDQGFKDDNDQKCDGVFEYLVNSI